MPRPISLAATLILIAGLLPGVASADRVTVKGVVLEGSVKSLDAKQIVFETVYGKGDLTISLADIEAIETEGDFYLWHGDDIETVGRLVGATPEAIQMDKTAEGRVDVPTAELLVARRSPGEDADLVERAHVELPYWSASFDVAFSATQATDDTLALTTGLGVQRTRGPARTKLGARYQLGKEKKDGESSDTTANEIRGFLRQEYDLTSRLFAFGQLDAEYDEVESLSIRLVPKAGLGYFLYKSENLWLSVDAGPAYVYERFFGGDTNKYPGIGFGAESDWKLPILGASWHNRLDYTPSFKDFFGDYLLRFETGLLIPMTESLSLKFALIDAYDSTPADDAKKNSLSTLVGLALGF
jgi:putative salt-induced outer membrane protein YdiY